MGAEQREPLKRRVALKIVKPGMDSRAVIARFEQERQALAVMDHPNVARVIDAGTTPRDMGSRPYFVMELVQGEAITTYCDRHRLTVRQRLELFIPVCEAVQHAHHKGVIHRDIKPSNVLVELVDGEAVPKVIDFGVAKAIVSPLTEKTIFTERGTFIGTPEYMSPEQAEMGALDVDTRTDVYSLGVLLYELLTGVLPFDPKDLRAKGYGEIQRIIREVDPPTPSKRLTTLGGEEGAEIARKRQTAREELAGELRRGMEWIPLKAMRKERDDRHTTAREMAEDIRRFFNREPLRAGPRGGAYFARMFIKRNRILIVSIGAAALALTGLLAGALWAVASLREMNGRLLVEVAERRRAEDALEDRASASSVMLASELSKLHEEMSELFATGSLDLDSVIAPKSEGARFDFGKVLMRDIESLRPTYRQERRAKQERRLKEEIFYGQDAEESPESQFPSFNDWLSIRMRMPESLEPERLDSIHRMRRVWRQAERVEWLIGQELRQQVRRGHDRIVLGDISSEVLAGVGLERLIDREGAAALISAANLGQVTDGNLSFECRVFREHVLSRLGLADDSKNEIERIMVAVR